MPCWTVQEAKVKFGVKTDLNLLKLAMEEMKMYPQHVGNQIRFQGGEYNTKTGELTFSGIGQSTAEKRAKELNKAYSGQIVLQTARKFGWQVQKVDKYKYAIQRR